MNAVCHITGQSENAADMLRFVRAPDGELTPDLAGKLPGQALWTCNRRSLVERLAGDEKAADDLPDRVEMLMRRQLAALLGLARKAGQLLTGFAKVDAALKAGRLHMLVIAENAGADGLRKLAGKAKAQNIAIMQGLSGEELTMALGRENVIHAGLTDAGWAGKLADENRRLAAYLGREEQE